jgi:hypothetical protein
VNLIREFLVGACEQFEIRLVNEGGCLKRVVGPFAGKMSQGNPM